MLYSIIQIVAFQALFLLVYDLFLRKETFFNINRAYLLVTSLLSLVLPFVQLPELQKVTTKDVIIQLPEVFIGQQNPTDYEVFVAEKVGIILEQPSMPIWQIILLLGIAVATLIFIVKLLKINKLKSNNPKRWSGEILIVNLLRSNKAFSFFNTIFLGEDIPELEKRTIYNHELVHVKEKHSLDLLFFELLRILFWFNPLVYIYQYRVKELHEFIADAKAVKQNGKAEYYQSLLHQIFDTNTLSFTNTFFKKSLIKQRITMLQKSKSNRKNLLKYMLLFPLVFAMLVYTSTEVKAQEKEVVEAKINQELTDEELIEIYYNDILKMREEGAKYFEISNYAGFGQNHSESYIKSREDYLKTSAFMRFMAYMMKETKSKNDELTNVNQTLYKKMTELPHKNYKGYLEWKKTDEAKERWMSNARDNSLRLVVDDMADKTKEEQQRFDGLMKQLETDSYYKKLIITDGRSTLVVDSPLLTEENEIAEVPFNVIDESPTIKSCQDLATNDERKQCFSEYINKHVYQHFNKDLEQTLGYGRKRIFTRFIINSEGKVTDIQARAPSEILEEEAKRVIALLPQFIPGRHNGEEVDVPFSLPIIFQVAKNDIMQLKKRYKKLIAERDRILKHSSEKNPVVINLNEQIEGLKKKIDKAKNSKKD